jgi:hypothetical protein
MASRKMKNKLKHKTGAWLKNSSEGRMKRWAFFTPSRRRKEKKTTFELYDYTF